MTQRDEVCGMELAEADVVCSVVHAGVRYVFCCTRCREHFVEHPEWFVEVPADRGLTS